MRVSNRVEVPALWLRALCGHLDTAPLVRHRDHRLLSYLTDIRVEQVDTTKPKDDDDMDDDDMDDDDMDGNRVTTTGQRTSKSSTNPMRMMSRTG